MTADRDRLARVVRRFADDARELADQATTASADELALATQTLAEQALRLALRAARLDAAEER
ncbi:hypothetical protein [Kitasatospora kifunensis]|uniref:Uncharacterized protein n=1 Tax=Kitasatospora kifunensis TaxID=58351 RepID=A0A7W7QZW4_KITKI|nr:hypothetical protein [Kitasatospora kifunensis]MBB4922196.1 hypothetical protein [Kitasatospora kifunensis]